MASIEPRFTKSGERRWVVRYRTDGRSREKRFRTMADARLWKARVEVEVASGTWIDPKAGQQRLEAWIEVWWTTQADRAEKTLDSYRSLINSRIGPQFGHVRLDSIRRSTVTTWVAGMNREGLSGSRIAQGLNLLGRLMEAAVADRLIPENPTAGIKRPAPARVDADPFTRGQIEQIIDSVDDRVRVLVALLAFTGMRVGEAYALRRSSINPLKHRITISESLASTSKGLRFGPTKTHANREVAIPARLWPMLEEHLATVPVDPDALVFTSPEGHPIRHSNMLRRYWYPALEAAGVARIGMHHLRRSCASLLTSEGVSIVDVAALLGHREPTVMLRHYARPMPDHQERVAAMIDRIFAAG